ncbi:vascular endothelial growth factor receptor 1 isoform X3 [Sipha flava]|uniref:receptor protein-tyrosine kinase n=1 Tax=Sipha flava TaxID=143950 RepID=A0A8B8G8F7_9HEMI|nr:vascular endothelial growth factor receptor 1 isoform X3 [Sipha flava]
MIRSVLLHVVAVVVTVTGTVSALDLQIVPDVPELTLTSGADFILQCMGDVPVTWKLEKYDPNLNVKKMSSIDISQGLLANSSHISLLTLSRASYLDTGYYYCVPLSETLKLDEQNSKSIYLFIQHDTYLLAVPEDLVMLSPNEYANVIIPCRPTSPDVNVTLFKDDEELVPGNSYNGMEVHYDNKIGFFLGTVTMFSTGFYNCRAELNHKEYIPTFHYQLFVMPKIHQVEKPYINSSGQSDHIIIGQNLSLNCSVSMDIGIGFTLRWKVPDEQKLKTEHMKIGKQNFFNGLKHGIGKSVGSILLNIQNVSSDDEGEYICEVTVHSGHTNRNTFNLKTFTPDMTYLNLTVQGGIYKIIRRAGYQYVQWIILVSAYPAPTLVWRDPDGREIGKENIDKVSVENDKSTSKLVIRDLQLYDSGVYELVAHNDAHVQRITVTLLVENEPFVEIANKSTVGEFYELGKVHSVQCYVGGYPLPGVEWSFKQCSNYPNCDDSFIKLSRNMYKEVVFKETFLVSTLNITATETGIFLCNATNDFGNSSEESTFLVTDLSKGTFGLDINGPPLVVDGDNVIVECGASKYYYQQDIKWIHRTLNNIEIPMQNTENINITNSTSKFSHRSYLTIKNITKKFDGEFLCLLIELNKKNVVTKSYKLSVKDSFRPVIYESSNSSLEIKTGTPVQWKCYVRGMPPPTISWFLNDQKLFFNKSDSRMLLKDKNQTLIIRYAALQDGGLYKCNASNRIGSVIATNTLSFLDKPKDHEHFGFIAFCSVLIVLLGVLMIGCATRLKRERKLRKELALAGLLYFENGAVESWNPDLGIEEQAELLPYDKRWEFPRDKLKLGKQLGSGAFGVVFKADAIGIIDRDTTTTVAVKMVKPNTDPSHIKALASELKIMIHLGRHLNVVNLLGAYTGNINKRELMVIVEYCRFGNIHQYLLKQRNCFVDQVTPDGYLDYNIKTISKNPYYENVPNNNCVPEKPDDSSTQIGSDGYLVADEPEWRSNYRGDYNNLIIKPLCTHDLLCWSFQVARGMEYLASRKILHGDLATRNILLAEDNIVKICDFGFAKTMYNSENYKKQSANDLLPVKWMAIESLRDRVFSTQSDVWAFGIVLWEIFSLAVTPYPNIQKFNELFEKLVGGYRMEQPKYANFDIYNIMLDCWKMNPMTRPSFTDLSERLGDLLKDGTKSHYMNLNEVYMRMNTEGSPSTDYLSLLTAPTYLNCSTVSENNSNSYPNISEHSETKEDLELKPMLYSSAMYDSLRKP